MSTERATVRVVSTGTELPPVEDPRREPESLPPAATLPPQELETDLGGPTLPNPTADERVEAAGGSVAERMRARFESMQATAEFSVPGWELEDGRPGLIIEARAFGDRKAFNAGISNEAFIARSTHRLFFVNDDGSREEVPGGWGPGLANMIGVSVVKAADLVALVISKPDAANPGTRRPNVVGINALATEIVEWARSGRTQAEEDLGE